MNFPWHITNVTRFVFAKLDREVDHREPRDAHVRKLPTSRFSPAIRSPRAKLRDDEKGDGKRAGAVLEPEEA